MMRSLFVRFRALSVFAVLLTAVAVASCSEDIQAGATCPLLCPQGAPPLKDTIIDAVTFDTSIAGFPPLGFESSLVLARRGDTLDSRIVTRYDTLPVKYSAAGQDSTIKRIDSAYVTGMRFAEDSALTFRDSASVEVYDVTDAVDDTATAALLAEFTPANRIGVRKYGKGDKPDTLRIVLDTARVRLRVITTHRLHIALRMVTTGSEQVRIISHNSGEGITLTVRASRDTAVAALLINPNSDFAPDKPFLSPAVADFNLIALGSPPAANALRVGGMPWRRVMFRFRIPSRIVDSAGVIRATLFLTQRPMRTGSDAGDSVKLHVVPVIVSDLITDLHQMLEFAGATSSYSTDSVMLVPRDSVRRGLEIVNIVRSWRGQDTIRTPRAIALVLGTEGNRPAAVDFYSIEAPPGLRPQLRLSYVTKLNSGRP